MPDITLASPLLLCVLVVIVGATSSLLPFSPAEPWLLGVAAIAPAWLILPLVALVIAQVALPIKTYALLSMNSQGWLTRRSDLTGGEAQDEASLGAAPAPAAAAAVAA